MFWADELVSTVISTRPSKSYWVDDMKTPSGRVHVGALRGVIIHGLIHQLLLEKGKQSTFSYVFNDMDPMDGFPEYLPDSFRQHMGKPLFTIPSPEIGADSLADLYASEFTTVFNSLGFRPVILKSSEMYQAGKFDAIIRQVLDRKDKIYDLYHTISGYNKPGSWYPYQVICPNCGKVGTTITTGWDGNKVSFVCQKDLVKWAQGCDYHGEIEPTGTNGKLMWKVDWAAHWKAIGITVEGAGKDHMTEHGSHDLSSAISEKVLDYPTPYGFLYEWFLAKGGSKMSSSKGVGVSAKAVSQTLSPEILRFLMVKTSYKKAIIFDPASNQSVLDLYDEFDRAETHYYQKSNPVESRAWELSQIKDIPQQPRFLPRFRDVVNVIQNPTTNINEYFTLIKAGDLTSAELALLEERTQYAKIWIDTYAPQELRFQITKDMPESVNKLSSQQQAYLIDVADMLEKTWNSPDELQQVLYQHAKDSNLLPKLAFSAMYTALFDKNHGPKAAWVLLENKTKIQKRFRSIQNQQSLVVSQLQSAKTQRFSFSQSFKDAYPSASVGFALIQGIKVQPFDQRLEDERQKLLAAIGNITTDALNQLPQLQSYRRMYKQMGVDWHSRRPSPEALLRRVATGKGLYPPINTCVDAYNLIVMKTKISSGAFDADNIDFPTTLDICKGGEQAFFIGDKQESTTLRAGEVSYFDKQGPYNMDFNYRDALRTAVTEATTNIWLNVDGIFDITPPMVQQALQENIDIILNYCGGKVVEQGIILGE